MFTGSIICCTGSAGGRAACPSEKNVRICDCVHSIWKNEKEWVCRTCEDSPVTGASRTPKQAPSHQCCYELAEIWTEYLQGGYECEAWAPCGMHGLPAQKMTTRRAATTTFLPTPRRPDLALILLAMTAMIDFAELFTPRIYSEFGEPSHPPTPV